MKCIKCKSFSMHCRRTSASAHSPHFLALQVICSAVRKQAHQVLQQVTNRTNGARYKKKYAGWPGKTKADSLGSNLSDVPLAVQDLLVRWHVVAHQRLRRHDRKLVRSCLLALSLPHHDMLQGISMQHVWAAGDGRKRSHQDHHHDMLGDADRVAACARYLLMRESTGAPWRRIRGKTWEG
jgi:hypothetical protein